MKVMYRKITRTLENLILYCKQIPVLGFNSAKYDLNLVRENWQNTWDYTIQKPSLMSRRETATCVCLTTNSAFSTWSNISHLPPLTPSFWKHSSVQNLKDSFRTSGWHLQSNYRPQLFHRRRPFIPSWNNAMFWLKRWNGFKCIWHQVCQSSKC